VYSPPQTFGEKRASFVLVVGECRSAPGPRLAAGECWRRAMGPLDLIGPFEGMGAGKTDAGWVEKQGSWVGSPWRCL